MDYDFSHWDTLPKVSCQCITYGRTVLLDEAIECFLKQDYPGEKELVILNDYVPLEIRGIIPSVTIINLPRRMRSIGEKRNACVALCSGDVILPWDDDDISLPHRISHCVSRMTNHQYYKGDRAWMWKNGAIDVEPKRHILHAMGAWSVEFFNEVGGYPHIESGQDQAIEKLFRKADGHRRVVEVLEFAEDIYYIYRFPGTGSYHLSAYGWDKGMERVDTYLAKKEIASVHRITPHWQQDYSALVQARFAEQEDVDV